jgi:hypothetical protein
MVKSEIVIPGSNTTYKLKHRVPGAPRSGSKTKRGKLARNMKTACEDNPNKSFVKKPTKKHGPIGYCRNKPGHGKKRVAKGRGHTVAELKSVLKTMGVSFSSKARKPYLQQLYNDHVRRSPEF